MRKRELSHPSRANLKKLAPACAPCAGGELRGSDLSAFEKKCNRAGRSFRGAMVATTSPLLPPHHPPRRYCRHVWPSSIQQRAASGARRQLEPASPREESVRNHLTNHLHLSGETWERALAAALSPPPHWIQWNDRVFLKRSPPLVKGGGLQCAVSAPRSGAEKKNPTRYVGAGCLLLPPGHARARGGGGRAPLAGEGCRCGEACARSRAGTHSPASRRGILFH